MEISNDQISSSWSDDLPEIRFPPSEFTEASIANVPQPVPTELRSPIANHSEQKKKGTKEQLPAKHKQYKKQTERKKFLDGRVEEQSQPNIDEFIPHMGQDEATTRSVLNRYGQEGCEISDSLLANILQEEEWKKFAPKSEPKTHHPPREREQPEYEPLRGSMESMNQQENTSSERRINYHEGQASDTARQLFGQFKLRLAEHLALENCLRLSTLLSLPWACYEMLKDDLNPAIRLFDMLESRGIITVDNVTPLEVALSDLSLRRAAREVTEYQSVANRMDNKPESSTEGESDSDAFEPNPSFVELLDQVSEYLSRSDIVHLCTYFSMSRREKDTITANKNPGHTLLMLIYKKGAIGPDDVLFLTVALKEVNLKNAARKLDNLMHIRHLEEYRQQSAL